ncbi:MAG: TadE/TadG family type IV pilus assembly protein [Chthoniobacteraceae bacterium]
MNEKRPKTIARRRPSRRRGAAVVEAAIVFPLMLTMLTGMFEVGRLVQVSQIVQNAARQGARVAGSGYIEGTPVTASTVTTCVRNYLTAANLPSAAVSGATITVTPIAPATWTDPSSALPLDQFQVTVTIPQGTAMNALFWTSLTRLTSAQQISATVKWYSLNESRLTVSTTLPY